ncbi:hypothetical protein MPSEU_000719100 [Mayamaea pseudoterrestris]|nr:hypothetical protein MPSEU_000719100 [Mayamaea pseudoterrestris]
MDFAAALAKLEKTANATTNSSQDRKEESDDKRRRHPETYSEPHEGRPHQRMRYDHHSQRHGPSNSLDELVRFGYHIRPSSHREALYESTSDPKHICLMLLCIDSVPYFDIWKAFANPTDHDTNTIVSLVIHAKYPQTLFQDEIMKKFLLVHPPRLGRGNSYDDPEPFSLSPNWGSVQLTQAMICLLKRGMQIGLDKEQRDERFATRRFVLSSHGATLENVSPVDHFVFISESCLPVRTLRECVHMIWGSDETVVDKPPNGGVVNGSAVADGANTREGITGFDEFAGNDNAAFPPSNVTGTENKPVTPHIDAFAKSWLHARNLSTPGVPRNKYERDQFQNIHRMVPQFCRWKADQWVLLSRPHASSVLQVDAHMRPEDQLIHSFSKVPASDEMYFPTVLAVLGILKEGDISSGISTRQVTYVDWTEGMRNPACFERGIRDFRRVAMLARQQGCLFARKFVLRHPGRDEVTGQISGSEWTASVIEFTRIQC